MKAMENIKAGSIWINDPLADNNAAPFGGMRHSGIGRELGAEGLDAFREPKHVHLDYIQERASGPSQALPLRIQVKPICLQDPDRSLHRPDIKR
jgi:hypothetical protein